MVGGVSEPSLGSINRVKNCIDKGLIGSIFVKLPSLVQGCSGLVGKCLRGVGEVGGTGKTGRTSSAGRKSKSPQPHEGVGLKSRQTGQNWASSKNCCKYGEQGLSRALRPHASKKSRYCRPLASFDPRAVARKGAFWFLSIT